MILVGEPLALLGRWTVRVSDEFEVDVMRSGEGWRITLAGDIDAAADEEFRAALAKALARTGSHVIVDLAGVTFLDSTGINALILAYKASEAAGVKLVVEPGPETVMRALRIAGIDGLLGLGDARVPDVPPSPPGR